jgi:hypothetical protein
MTRKGCLGMTQTVPPAFVASRPPASSPSSVIWLLLAGALVVGPAIGFARRYPLPPNAGELTDIGKLAHYAPLEFAGYVGGLAVMFVGYLWGLWLCQRIPARRALPAVFAVAILAALAMAWMYPVNAIDLFIYAVRSRIFTAHGANPLAVPPIACPRDPLMRFASVEWGDDVSPYGPLWTLIAAPATAFAGRNLPHALLAFKSLAVVATLAGGWIAARIAAIDDPERAAGAALVYLWNPLVLWEGIGNGHNDVVMMAIVLLALLAWARRDDVWTIPLLVVAAAVKYVALALLPLAAVALWRCEPGGAPASFGGSTAMRARLRLLLASALLSISALIVAFAPFYDLSAARASVEAQGDIALTSPAAIAITALAARGAPPSAQFWVRAASLGLFGVGLIVALAAVWRRPAAFPCAAFETMFLLLLVATWNFRPWYVIWLVALAACLPLGWPAARAIVWSAGGLAGYALFIWGWEWTKWPWPTVQLVGVLLMTGPVVIVTMVEGARLLGRDVRREA